MPLVERVTLQHVDDASGSIVIGEAERNVPFEIRRVYYLHNVPQGANRGGHAHKELVQLAVCVHGSCRFGLDNGAETADVILDSPHEGILIRSMVWRTMSEFSPGAVLLVFASAHYDERDYIRSYDEFIHAVAR
jgi:UDP-2-acetamido-3-amino-2,3-dideoxy-glucuronate N-acetyltransferase